MDITVKKNEKGFTLIELLIVIAIIAILAAIAIPQFSKYRARGYAGTLNSDAKNAYTAAQALVADGVALALADCADLETAGYVRSAVVTCSKNLVDAANWTITMAPAGNAAGLVNNAVIDQDGTLAVSTVVVN